MSDCRCISMYFQYWDLELEKLAQDWANACHVSHRPNAGRKNVGTLAPGSFFVHYSIECNGMSVCNCISIYFQYWDLELEKLAQE